MNELAERFGQAFLAEPWLPQVFVVILAVAAIKLDVLMKVAEIITRHGAEMAFPTRTQHVESLPPEVVAT